MLSLVADTNLPLKGYVNMDVKIALCGSLGVCVSICKVKLLIQLKILLRLCIVSGKFVKCSVFKIWIKLGYESELVLCPTLGTRESC